MIQKASGIKIPDDKYFTTIHIIFFISGQGMERQRHTARQPCVAHT